MTAVGQVTASDVTGAASRPPGRVLRPMIIAKQLDLPEGPTGTDVPAALPMPRTQLTRELEKYSRPASAAALSSVAEDASVSRNTWGAVSSLNHVALLINNNNNNKTTIYKAQ